MNKNETEQKNYKKYVKNNDYRSLTSDDIKWYLEQKKDNDELKKVEHIAIDIDNDTYAKKNEKQILAEYENAINKWPSEQRVEAIKTAKLNEIVIDKLFNHMKESLKINGNKDFCKKLLISNTDGLHTYAFTYGFANKEPFFIIFSDNAEQVFNLVMNKSKKSKDALSKKVEESFKDSLFSIYCVSDSKSCGTIALKIMKYLTYEDIKEIIKNKDNYFIDRDDKEIKNILVIKKKNKKDENFFSSHTLPRKLVQYIQSIQNIQYHDKYNNYNTEGKEPGTVYNKIRSKNRIKMIQTKDGNKEVNTTAEVKQKQIINKITVKRGKRKANDIGVSTYL